MGTFRSAQTAVAVFIPSAALSGLPTVAFPSLAWVRGDEAQPHLHACARTGWFRCCNKDPQAGNTKSRGLFSWSHVTSQPLPPPPPPHASVGRGHRALNRFQLRVTGDFCLVSLVGASHVTPEARDGKEGKREILVNNIPGHEGSEYLSKKYVF